MLRTREKMNNEYRTLEPQNVEVGETTSKFTLPRHKNHRFADGLKVLKNLAGFNNLLYTRFHQLCRSVMKITVYQRKNNWQAGTCS